MIDDVKVTKSQEDGFKTGLNWPDAWMNHGEPGGPWVPSAGFDEKSRVSHAQASAENKAWRSAWKA